MLSRRHLVLGLGGLAAGLVAPNPVQSAIIGLQGPLPSSSTMSAGKLIPAPAAWLSLLRRHPELAPKEAPFVPVQLSVARAAQLVKVNKEVNKEITFRDDTRGADLWQVGVREGDCEDYAIRKLQVLVEGHGFPRGALTLAACRLESGRGHAVLLVHSDRGVYVMDNLAYRVTPWRALPYSWVAREEPGAPFLLWRNLTV
ncbi:MAG: transglutaminase-like cysteine peptidase [Kiloniellaceae bacterium]